MPWRRSSPRRSSASHCACSMRTCSSSARKSCRNRRTDSWTRAVEVSARARELAARCGKDPRLVEVILRESTDVVRCAPQVLIVRHRLGLVMANAGVDQSNVPGSGPPRAVAAGGSRWVGAPPCASRCARMLGAAPARRDHRYLRPALAARGMRDGDRRVGVRDVARPPRRQGPVRARAQGDAGRDGGWAGGRGRR